MSDAVTTEPTVVPRPPDPTPPPVPWDAGTLVFVIFFAFLAFFAMIWSSVIQEVLQSSGFFARYYAGQTAADAEQRQQLWTMALPFPFQVATILGFALLFLRVRPATLGLTRRCLGRNLLRGLGGAAVLTPIVLGLHQTVVWVYLNGLGIGETPHPLARIGTMEKTPLEWGLWLFAAVVAAPVVEELLFRGVFQPAAGRSRLGGAVGIALAAAFAAPTVRDAFSPMLFVLVLALVYLAVLRFGRGTAIPAVIGTSALFAMVHVAVWPSPIALFVLALGLGWLKERTQSLVGPMVLHSAFNAVSCALVIYERAK